MLLDSTHRKWAFAAAVLAAGSFGLYAVLAANTPGGLTGGSTAGLWYGAAGSALMAYAGLLSVLRRVPSWWWIGSRQTWLRGHIWLSLLAAVLVLCHSGFRWGGPLEATLWVVLIAVLGTGVFGLLLQQVLPRLMTRRVPFEASYEQLPHLCRILRGRADNLAEAIGLWAGQPRGEDDASEMRRFHDDVVRPYLDRPTRRSALASDFRAEVAFGQLRARLGLPAANDHSARAESLFDEYRGRLDDLPEKKELLAKAEAAFKKVRDNLLTLDEVGGLAAAAARTFTDLPAPPAAAGPVLDLRRLCQDRWVRELEQVCRERRGYAEQERIHHWLHGWLLLHVPLSLALLVLGALHAVLSLYY